MASMRLRRRRDVLDLDARALHAPGRGGVVDHLEQPVVDLVALGQRFIEVHRADHGADIGHGEIDHGEAQVGHFVRGLRRIEHLVEHHGVDGHHGVVLGDDLLAGHVEHLLHHVDLLADVVEERNQPVRAGRHGFGELPETFARVLETLRHDDQRLDRDDDDADEREKHPDGAGLEHVSSPQCWPPNAAMIRLWRRS